jgi:DNA-binding NarL/FixJ family response regulator
METISILLADDHAIVRAALRLLLDEQPDLTVVGEAGDGDEAIAKALELAPDVVLLDVMMPVVDGFGVLAAIRSDPDIAETPVVMYSALSDERTRLRAEQAGANDYLVKGTPFFELHERVAGQLPH